MSFTVISSTTKPPLISVLPKLALLKPPNTCKMIEFISKLALLLFTSASNCAALKPEPPSIVVSNSTSIEILNFCFILI